MNRPWTESLQRYAQNPLRNRRLLRRLEREGRGDHPPVVLLALADARLRSGSFAAAERLFARVSAANPEEPFGTWAALGRTWASLLAGGTPEPIGGEPSPVAAVLRGLVDAAQQRAEEATQSFARAVDDPRAPPALRAAAQLAAAYARYWARDDDAGTIAAFDTAVAAADGNLVDDARYGAARARLRAGDVSGALPMLHDLAAWHVNGTPGPAAPALVALDRPALLRAGFERYRRASVRTPEQQLHLMLDGDGAALARAALRELGEDAPEPRPTPAVRTRMVNAGTPARKTPPVVQVAVRPQAPARFHPSLDVVSAWLQPVLLGAAPPRRAAHRPQLVVGSLDLPWRQTWTTERLTAFASPASERSCRPTS
jgi:tetratricopeptide (TPR) repeat protein